MISPLSGAFGLLEGFERQVLQLGEEFPQTSGVVEPRAGSAVPGPG
jgi:hypothetical protein